MNSTLPDVDNLKNWILVYIVGYVVAKLSPTMKCSFCGPALEDSLDDPLNPVLARIIRLKDRGGLKNPSRSTFQIVLRAEEVFMSEIANNNKMPNTQNLFTYLPMKVFRLLNVNQLFPTLKEHVLEQNSSSVEDIHHIKLTKMIIFRYLKVRCLSYCNVINRRRNGTSSRNRNLKSTHFRNE